MTPMFFFFAFAGVLVARAFEHVDGVVLLQKHAEVVHRRSLVGQAASADVAAPIADFAVGLDGSNVCPSGYKAIGDEVACAQGMQALGLRLWGSVEFWSDRPGGCYEGLAGVVSLNKHTGSGKPYSAPICEREPELGVAGLLESRDAGGRWWSAVAVAKNTDGTYSMLLDDGTRWSGVLPFNLRRRSKASLVVNGSEEVEAGIAENGTEVLVNTEVVTNSTPATILMPVSLGKDAGFIMGADAGNGCPPMYKGIGDERTCSEAMLALGMGPLGAAVAREDHPGGCFGRPSSGIVYINNKTGRGAVGSAPICEKDFTWSLDGLYEARDQAGNWWPATVSTRGSDGTYSLLVSGASADGVSAFDVRRVLAETLPVGDSVPATYLSATVSQVSTPPAVSERHFASAVDAQGLESKGADNRSAVPHPATQAAPPPLTAPTQLVTAQSSGALGDLITRKQAAVTAEDYDLAKELKAEVDALSID